jgi:hypothetical protein
VKVGVVVRRHSSLLAVGWCLAGCVCTVPQGAQLAAAGWRAARGGGPPVDRAASTLPRAAARHTHHTAGAALSAGTSTSTGGRWQVEAAGQRGGLGFSQTSATGVRWVEGGTQAEMKRENRWGVLTDEGCEQ